jgi:hypothetical protein
MYDVIMRILTGTSRNMVASANLCGFCGIFSAPHPNHTPVYVNVKDIPRGLPKAPLYWLMLTGLPPWCSPAHLNVIFAYAFAVRDIHFIFPYLEAVNTPQTSIETRQTPALVVCFASADSLKRTLKSQDLVAHTINGLHVAEPDTPLRIEFTIMPGTNVRLPTAQTSPLELLPLSSPRLLELLSTADLPDDPDIDLDSTADELAADPFRTMLSPHRITQTFDYLEHQLRNDLTNTTLTRVLTTLAAYAPATGARDPIYGNWIPTILGMDRLRYYIDNWVNMFALPFRQVDGREEIQEDTAQHGGSPPSATGNL